MALKASRDGAATAAQGNLCKSLPTLTGMNFFLTSNLSSFKFRPFPLSCHSWLLWKVKWALKFPLDSISIQRSVHPWKSWNAIDKQAPNFKCLSEPSPHLCFFTPRDIPMYREEEEQWGIPCPTHTNWNQQKSQVSVIGKRGGRECRMVLAFQGALFSPSRKVRAKTDNSNTMRCPS